MADRNSPQVALDKLTFLIAFVPYLTHQGRVSVAEAAAHFGYDEDFIRRSALALTVTGVAAGSLPDGELFDIDFDALEHDDEIVLVTRIAIEDEVPRLSGREAAALIAGLHLLGRDPAIGASAEYASLLDKLRHGAAADPMPTAVMSTEVANFAPLRTAIEERRRVAFDYRGAGSDRIERREVEPLRIESIDATYHLRAWCLLRGALRTFRLDRISGLELLTTPSAHDVTAIDDAASAFIAGPGETIVTIGFDPDAEPLALAYRPIEVDDTDPDTGQRRMRVAITAPSTLQRLLSEIPGAVVLDPAEVRHAVRDWATAVLGRYGGPDH
ncbi:MAG TPA: WYL domain-containing protein [Microbacteriaceae bacterium]|nr:WYL domain-containing protein [Microbacteriaceae bacterium]